MASGNKILGFIAGKIRALSSPSKYQIKKGYNHRKTYNYYDDTEATDECQRAVYEEVKHLMEAHNLKTVLDFGCGSAYKLLNYLGEYNTIGVDVSPTYEHLVEKYPDRKWIHFDNFKSEETAADIIVCADVIEHVLDPDDLLNKLKNCKNYKFIVISTPDRDLVRGKLDYGPPANPCHVREWSVWEFERYIKEHFDIVEHRITHIRQATQMVICKRKGSK